MCRRDAHLVDAQDRRDRGGALLPARHEHGACVERERELAPRGLSEDPGSLPLVERRPGALVRTSRVRQRRVRGGSALVGRRPWPELGVELLLRCGCAATHVYQCYTDNVFLQQLNAPQVNGSPETPRVRFADDEVQAEAYTLRAAPHHLQNVPLAFRV